MSSSAHRPFLAIFSLHKPFLLLNLSCRCCHSVLSAWHRDVRPCPGIGLGAAAGRFRNFALREPSLSSHSLQAASKRCHRTAVRQERAMPDTFEVCFALMQGVVGHLWVITTVLSKEVPAECSA